MSTTVVGLFNYRHNAENAVQDLLAAGFDRKRISILAADPDGNLYRDPSFAGGIAAEDVLPVSSEDATVAGTSVGLTSGAVVGGVLGILIGVGLLFVPMGALAAGPIAGLIAGGAAGAATGGVIGGLIGMGVAHQDAEIYAESVRRGATLVTVLAEDEEADHAHRILDRDGAINIDDRRTWYEERGFQGYDPHAPALSEAEAAKEREDEAARLSAGAEEERERVRRYPSGPGTGSGAYADYPTSVAEQVTADPWRQAAREDVAQPDRTPAGETKAGSEKETANPRADLTD